MAIGKLNSQERLSMKIYKVEFEIVLKNDDINWLWDTIEQQLESGEFLDSQLIEEVTDEQTN